MDGGGGFVHVPEDCYCVCPSHRTLYHCSLSHLLEYVGDDIHVILIYLFLYLYAVVPLVPVVIPLSIDRNLLVKRNSTEG